jgi:hypothetical protein
MSAFKPGDKVLESRVQQDKTLRVGAFSIAPAIEPDYWTYRVRLSETQAIVGFPKFFTVGIGFAEEEDSNTNLPYTCDAEEIYEHIAHNKGDDSISRDDCIDAIRLIQQVAKADREPLYVDPELVPGMVVAPLDAADTREWWVARSPWSAGDCHFVERSGSSARRNQLPDEIRVVRPREVTS